jgi:hypothetical protein
MSRPSKSRIGGNGVWCADCKNPRPSAPDQNGKAGGNHPAQYSVNYTAGSPINRGFRRLV